MEKRIKALEDKVNALEQMTSAPLVQEEARVGQLTVGGSNVASAIRTSHVSITLPEYHAPVPAQTEEIHRTPCT